MVIKKYTPPTCTLEIKAKESPLSRWAGQTVLKQLHFELRFDDPRQPEEKRVTIWGDRSELEALHEAVTTYVQDFLNQSPAPIPVTSFESNLLASESLPTPRFSERSKTAENLEPLSSGFWDRHGSTALATSASVQTASIFYLQPKGMLTHNLFLGPLETEESGPCVSLSALQLFDLATALDEFASEAVALPQTNRPGWLQAPPPWAKAAAMVVLTVGFTTVTVKLLDRFGGSPRNTTKAPSPPTSSPAAQTSVFAQAPIVPPPPIASPTLINPLEGTKTPLGAPLLKTPGRLLPPSSIVAPPQPRIISQPTFVIPETGKTSPQSNSLPTSRTSRVQSSNGKSLTRKGSSPSQQSTKVAKSQGQPEAASTPLSPPTIPAPPSLSNSRRKQGGESQDNLPQLTASLPTPPIPTSPTYSSDSLSRGSGVIADSDPNSRLFDTIPQVAQVRGYFQKRWQPPEELKQPLEYHLILNGNGSIDHIIPLSSAAATYLNRTNMPVLGQPFVSATDKGSAPTIRLVLYPSGQVETFAVQN